MRITHDFCQQKSDTALLIDNLKGNEPTKFRNYLYFMQLSLLDNNPQ